MFDGIGNPLLSAQRRLRVDREPVSMIDLVTLATRLRLTTCDTAYLELAPRRGLPLATRDAALRSAMPEAGVVAAEWPR